jgi:carboxyl-terminal processing protease
MKAQFKNAIILTVVFCIALSIGLSGGVIIDRRLVAANGGTTQDTTVVGDLATYDLLSQAWNLIKNVYVDQSAASDTSLVYAGINGMVQSLGDTGHSRFMTPEELVQESNYTSGSYEGIGAQVTYENGQVIIAYPLEDSPAMKAGIQAGDIITAVDGVDMTGLTLDEVVSHVMGEAGTTVKLTVLRPATGQTLDIEIVREKIAVKNVTWSQIPGTTLAFVRVATFSSGVTDDLEKILESINDQNLTGIILDLRNNPGGLLPEAVTLASQFLGDGNVLLEKDASGTITPIAVSGNGLATEIPLVVLVNGGSASASEIVAGAIQDQKRAQLIGTTTYGTGTILNQFNLSDGSALLLATQEWLTPNGNTIWHTGIVPDITVDLPTDGILLSAEEIGGMTAEQLSATTDSQFLKALETLTQLVSGTDATTRS